MKITIITAAFNSVMTVEGTLESVRSQTHGDVEHVIVDGGSSDGTLSVVERFLGQSTKLVSEMDGGVYDAMNKGLRLAEGDVIGFLNADDFYEHDRVLETVAKVMSKNEIDACYADLVYIDPSDTTRVTRYWKSKPYTEGLCRKGWMPAHPTFFVRRNVYARYGAFDLEFRRQADFELALRLFDVHKINSEYVPEVWVRMRTGGLSNNSVVGVLKGNIEAYRACRKNGFKVTPFFIARKMLSRIPQFFVKPSSETTRR